LTSHLSLPLIPAYVAPLLPFLWPIMDWAKQQN
jgi:hypothetical protein